MPSVRVARQRRGFQVGGQCPRQVHVLEALGQSLPNVLRLSMRAQAVGPDGCCRSLIARTILFFEHWGGDAAMGEVIE